MNIIIRPNDCNYIFEDILLNRFENVSNYFYTPLVSELYLSLKQKNDLISLDKTEEIYFMFDSPGEDAFAHWVYESFIFYPMLQKLNEKYKNIKIVTKNTKKYVKLLCNFFNIKNKLINYIESDNNVCFFPPVLALNDLYINHELYILYINKFIYDINSKIENVNLSINKILCLPRNNVDNYKHNDRSIEHIESIKKNVIDLGGVVLNSYELNNLFLQFSIINNSQNIIVDYGSSFLVNCIFCKNKKIIVLDNTCSMNSQIHIVSIKILCDIIVSNNDVIILTNYKESSDVMLHCNYI